MIWLIMLVATIALGAFVLYLGGKPAMNRLRSPRDLLRAFTTFEVGGKEGALLFIEQRKSGKFLQFRLDGSNAGRASISFGFPNVTWSQPWYVPMKAAVAEARFESTERVGSDGTRFLDVDDLTVPQAVALSELALGVLDLADLSSLRFHFEGPMESPISCCSMNACASTSWVPSMPNRRCSRRRSYGTRRGTRSARVHGASLFVPPQLNAIR